MHRSRMAAVGAIFMGLLSCGKAQSDAVAVIPKGTNHEFWKSVHAGAVKASRELNVRIVWKGPLKEDDREDQIKVVENFVNLGVRGIVLAPLDDAALAAPVENAVRSGIPVVIIDSDLKSKEFVSFVATDNYVGGTFAGDEMARILGGQGKVIMLRYAEGSASTTNREKGFMDAVARHKAIEVVSHNQYAGATTTTAITAGENLLQRFKTTYGLSIDGIFCPNESSAAGMLTVLEQGGLAGKVKFIGFDSSPPLVNALEKGFMHATVVQDPINMGYLGVKTLLEHLQGKKVQTRIDTGATLVTKANMGESRVQELLKPPFARWLEKP